MTLDIIHKANTPIDHQRFNYEVDEFSSFDKIEVGDSYIYAAKFLYKTEEDKNNLVLKSVSETKKAFYLQLARYSGEIGLITSRDDFDNDIKKGYFISPITVTENTVIYFKGSDINRATINGKVSLKEIRPYTMGLKAFVDKYL